jgi:hypothetical protein
MKSPTLGSLASEQLTMQLAEVEDRLTHDYDEVGTLSVHNLVERERARFADARIHVYVPILVERAVRTSLAGSAGRPRQ